MGPTPISESDHLVSMLQAIIARGESSWKNAPQAIKRICKEGCWKDRQCEVLGGKRVRFGRFEEFVVANLPEGLEASIAILQRLCKEDKEALDLIDREVERPKGERLGADSNNVTICMRGNTEQAALRRLRKDRPDLHARILSGKMSAHAAMVEAGFRRRTLTIPDDPHAAAGALRRHFAGDRLAALVEALKPPLVPCWFRHARP